MKKKNYKKKYNKKKRKKEMKLVMKGKHLYQMMAPTTFIKEILTL
jgi:hypothetical protein